MYARKETALIVPCNCKTVLLCSSAERDWSSTEDYPGLGLTVLRILN